MLENWRGTPVLLSPHDCRPIPNILSHPVFVCGGGLFLHNHNHHSIATRLRVLSDSHADAVVLSGALESDVDADERLARTGVLVRRRLDEDYEIVREIRRGVVCVPVCACMCVVVLSFPENVSSANTVLGETQRRRSPVCPEGVLSLRGENHGA